MTIHRGGGSPRFSAFGAPRGGGTKEELSDAAYKAGFEASTQSLSVSFHAGLIGSRSCCVWTVCTVLYVLPQVVLSIVYILYETKVDASNTVSYIVPTMTVYDI